MPTITMQGIADLARVQRPVVSTWRRRFAEGQIRFPPPLSGDTLLFDADEVARWLIETQHGNNSDAQVEAHLYSDTFDHARQNLLDISALLLLSHATGETTDVLTEHMALNASFVHELDAVVDDDEIVNALRKPHLRQTVDLLADAAFSPRTVLERLHQAELNTAPVWKTEALTDTGIRFMTTVIATLFPHFSRNVVLSGPAALPLGIGLAAANEDETELSFALGSTPTTQPAENLARRLLSALAPTTADDPVGPALRLHAHLNPTSAAQFFAAAEEALLSTGEGDILLVLGPASLMIDEEGASDRQDLLLPHPRHPEMLRYGAELPRGLCRFLPRGRLAIWGFGARDSRWTVIGAHSGSEAHPRVAEHIGSDLSAALSGDNAILSHAFSTSAIRATNTLVRLDCLAIPAERRASTSGGDRLARVWELDTDALVSGIIAAPQASPAALSLSEAIDRSLVADLAGTQLPASLIDPLRAGAAPVLGAAEVTGDRSVGERGIDRLLLEQTAPHAYLTRPDDVIYVLQPRPQAIVDEDGGNVVQSPARVLRCRDRGEETLCAQLVALDINRQTTPNRSQWQLRLVPQDTATLIAQVSSHIGVQRTRLEAELARVTALENEVIDSLGDRALVPDPEQ